MQCTVLCVHGHETTMATRNVQLCPDATFPACCGHSMQGLQQVSKRQCMRPTQSIWECPWRNKGLCKGVAKPQRESFLTAIGCRNNELMMAQASELMVAQFVNFLMAQGVCTAVRIGSSAMRGRGHCKFQLYKMRPAMCAHLDLNNVLR
jgi:hypothetical protein